jgi:methylglyoxal synthase
MPCLIGKAFFLTYFNMITRIMERRKRIALVAHDNKKKELIEWAVFNKATLAKHRLYATGTTGSLLEEKA